MPTNKIHKCDLLAEAEQHILLSNFIYLYSELRVLSGAGYAPFSPEDIDCKGGTSKGVLSDTIFLNLLKTLRKEDEDDPEGLIVALSKYPFVIADLRKLDEQIKQSLVDCGNPPKADYASHHHIGTPYNCLCAKHGLHYAQVLLDQTVTGAGAFDSDDHTKEEEDVQIDILSESTLLEALKQQLKPDSFLRSALSNPEKIVHINDSYPTKECVYAISSDESTQTIKVTFRGTVSKENWRANLRFERAWYPNPLQEEYPGRSDGVEFHKGFSDYLLRRRKDNGQSKLDEILDAVHTEGQAVFGGEKYRLVSTGHSLGGALATIFGYYASTNETLEIKKPVDILSFCSPRPGGVNFASAFQRQEKNKAVRHFRFYHKHDFVPRFKYGFDRHVDVHVGLGMEICKTKKKGQEGIRFSYRYDPNLVLYESQTRRLCRVIGTPFKFVRCRRSEHSLPLMLTRIQKLRETNDVEKHCRDLESLYKEHVHNKIKSVDLALTITRRSV